MNEIITIQSVREALQFVGMPSPKHPLIAVISHSSFKNWNLEAGMRVCFDLYMVSLKEGMSGSMQYGRNTYDFQEGTMTFIAPSQVLAPMEVEIETEGEPNPNDWSILFHPDLIRKSDLGESIGQYSFFSYDIHEALHLSEEEKESITEIVHKIEKEINQNIDRHSQKLIVSNLELLLDYCTRYYDRQFFTRTTFNSDIVTDFEHLLQTYYRSDKPAELGVPSVKYCGEELGISPNYLSDLLKKETGRNTIEHIHFFIIDKAKTRLLNSKQSVSQIAYELGFEYPQHFSKVFKNKTGQSPSEYRQTV